MSYTFGLFSELSTDALFIQKSMAVHDEIDRKIAEIFGWLLFR